MNRKELAAAMAEKTGKKASEMYDTIGAFMEVVEETLTRGEKIQLVGLGTFEVVERSAREGRNPSTGETIKIPATKAPKLKFGSGIKAAVKNS